MFLQQKTMEIEFYSADWCSDCISAKNFLESKGIIFKEIIITGNNDAIRFLEKVNNGKRIIPTIVIDGKVYSNPGINRLMEIIE